jgi:Prokaryotic membrane lipoprotein lipid attachment site
MRRIICLLSLVVALTGCGKPKPTTEEAPPPPPPAAEATPIPAPTPEATPTSTPPAANLAPEGILYITERGAADGGFTAAPGRRA